MPCFLRIPRRLTLPAPGNAGQGRWRRRLGRQSWPFRRCCHRPGASPAPEPFLGLEGQVKPELFIVSLVQSFEGCSVLVITDASNSAVAGHVERGNGKEGGDVGNELQREGPGRWNPFGGCCRQNCWVAISLTNSGSAVSAGSGPYWKV